MKPFQAPFKNYDGTIMDANSMLSLDVRGWGSLTNNPHHLSGGAAYREQMAFADRVCEALNNQAKEQGL